MDSDLSDKRYIRRLEKNVLQIKQKVRPCLTSEENGWKKHDYYNTLDLSSEDMKDNIHRIDRNLVSAERFRSNFEKESIPCIIINDQKNWDAHSKWTLDRLKLKYRNQYFRCGKDNAGNSVKIKMKHYIDYMKTNTDDSPLYIFDGHIEENAKKKRLLEDYVISDYFFEDLFNVLDSQRPPNRWFVMGPPRSGTSIHVDPLGTSAWNALVMGYKRWCLFPPNTPKFLLKPKVDRKWKNINEAINWFDLIYKRVTQPDWPEEYKMVEAIQRPGETIFVPGGWWHIVLNLTNTVAITQNFCSSLSFPMVWFRTNRERNFLAKVWYQKLQLVRSDLCHIADNFNLEARFSKIHLSDVSSDSSDEEQKNKGKSHNKKVHTRSNWYLSDDSVHGFSATKQQENEKIKAVSKEHEEHSDASSDKESDSITNASGEHAAVVQPDGQPNPNSL